MELQELLLEVLDELDELLVELKLDSLEQLQLEQLLDELLDWLLVDELD